MVRLGTVADASALADIYNHYIRETAITFDLHPRSVAEQAAWCEQFASAARHKLLVAERDGALAGFACSTAFRTKAAYDTTVETTVYVAPDAVGQGVGTALYGALLDALAGEDIHRAIAAITPPNPASVALHERFGFRHVATLDEVGRKFDRYHDVLWYEKRMR